MIISSILKKIERIFFNSNLPIKMSICKPFIIDNVNIKKDEKIYGLIDLHKKNNSVTFEFDVYIEEILKSYKYDLKNISQQFEVDFPRSTIYIDNTHVTSFDYFFHKLDWMSSINIDGLKGIVSLKDFIMMLSVQSSYAFPCILLQKIYNNINEKYILVNKKTNRNFTVNTKTQYLQIYIECDMALYDMSNEKHLKTINILLCFKFKMETSKILPNIIYNIYDIIDNDGLLIWKTY